MENEKLRGLPAVRKFIVLVVQGAIIGAGAILPGISGGVLCVAFGIYQPMMAILALLPAVNRGFKPNFVKAAFSGLCSMSLVRAVTQASIGLHLIFI